MPIQLQGPPIFDVGWLPLSAYVGRHGEVDRLFCSARYVNDAEFAGSHVLFDFHSSLIDVIGLGCEDACHGACSVFCKPGVDVARCELEWLFRPDGDRRGLYFWITAKNTFFPTIATIFAPIAGLV